MKKILLLLLLVSTRVSAQPTYFGNDSNLRTLVNLNLRSEEIDNASWTKTRTSVTANNIIAPDGTTTADTLSATTTTNSFLLSQSVSGALVGQTRRQIAHLRAGTLSHAVVAAFEATGGVTRGVRINIGTCAVDSSQNITSSSATAIGDGWCRVIFEYLVANNTAIETYVNLWDGTAGGYYPSFAATTASNIGVWGISSHLTSAPSTYIRTTDAQVTAGLTNTVAQVTESNLVTRSEELENAVWTQTRTTTTANQIAAPDGRNTADLITATATTGIHAVTPASSMGTIINGAQYRMSGYFKSGTVNRAQLYYQGSPNVGVNFNIDTCAQLQATAGVLTSTYTRLDNGWCRVVFTHLATATVSFPTIAFINSDSAILAPSFTALGTEAFYAWGIQINPVGAPPDYIPTTSAAVTLSGVCPAGTSPSINDPSRCFSLSNLPVLPVNGITSDVLATSAVEEIRDSILSRPLQDNYSTNSFGWIIDRIRKYTSNRMTKSGSTYTIYKDNETDVYETGTTNGVTRDPN